MDLPNMREFDKMRAGELYDPGDAELVKLRQNAQMLMSQYNATTLVDTARRNQIKKELFQRSADNVTIRAPFYVDYGINIHFEGKAFLNYGVVMLDVCPITIGDNVQIGPHAQIISADHPVDPTTRLEGLENGRAVVIEENVWIGASAIILPGVRIGQDAVIGAGAVVTRNVEKGVTVVGNPAREIKR